MTEHSKKKLFEIIYPPQNLLTVNTVVSRLSGQICSLEKSEWQISRLTNSML